MTAFITQYAADHGLDPADLIAVINSDPEPPEPVAVSGDRISTADGVYGDAAYPVDYLALVAEDVLSRADQ